MRNNNGNLLLPVFMLALALVLFLGFHVQRAWRESTDLELSIVALRQTTQETQGIKQRVERLAGGVQRLAEGGNANAKLLVERLQQAAAANGVAIK